MKTQSEYTDDERRVLAAHYKHGATHPIGRVEEMTLPSDGIGNPQLIRGHLTRKYVVIWDIGGSVAHAYRIKQSGQMVRMRRLPKGLLQ